MIKFNPESKEILTYGECLSPAMEITDIENAKQYLNGYVAYLQKHLDNEPRDDNKTALEIAKINLGYWAGYYSDTVSKRVKELFNASHPIFGDVIPTAKQAFQCGLQNKTLKEQKDKK